MNIISSRFVIIGKWFFSLFKNAGVNEKRIHHISFIEEAEINLGTSVEIPKLIGKNRWLYPTDQFGKMEEGVAGYETRGTYKRRN